MYISKSENSLNYFIIDFILIFIRFYTDSDEIARWLIIIIAFECA